MHLRTKVIVTDVTNLHDARYCAGMGVDWLAFPIDSALPNALSPADFAEIAGWLSGPRMAGMVKNAPTEGYQVEAWLTENAELLERSHIPVLLQINCSTQLSFAELAQMMEKYAPKVAAFILRSNDRQLDAATTAHLAELSAKYPIFLGFGITPDNAVEAIEAIAPQGIALTGGHEIKVGLNDFEGLADILEAIEVEA